MADAGAPDIFAMTAAEVERALAPVVERSLAAHGCPDATVRLINVSENATFLLEDGGERTVLRVHRHGYHDAASIESELAWMDALRTEAGVRTPRVVAAGDGSRVLSVGPGAPRHVVRFEFLPGAEPDAEDGLVDSFRRLGAITASMHAHAIGWGSPAGFVRFSWGLDDAIGPDARWGPWRAAAGVGAHEAAVLERADRLVRDRLARFGTGPERFGLIHADLRLANLLERDDETCVIDFDDAGFGWLLADFGGALTFIEHDPRVPELTDAWVSGYRSVRSLDRQEVEELPTFVMLRRLMALAWLGSHAETVTAEELTPGFAAQSCELAERYLTSHG